jgi:hypothetical protein
MGNYNTAYTFFHILIFISLIVLYAVLVYYIIPDFVEKDKKDMASAYTGYAFWIATSLLTVGSMIADYFDKLGDAKSQTIKGAKR